MSEHHSGAWGAREDSAVWWPGAITTNDYQQTLQSHHQHLLNQHQQQLQAAAQQQQQHAAAQQDAVARSTAAAAASEQLFTYKMASSFQNAATTSASCMRNYDYHRLGDSMVNVGSVGVGTRPGDGSTAAQWWYQSGGMGSPVQNVGNQMLPQNRGRMPRVKTDAKPRGRMTAYAFFVQTCREEHKKKHPDENVIFAEFSKKCAERWKTMLDKEKKRFHEMAEKDKKRYDTEMEGYIPPKGEKVRGKKRKHMKDPNAPKRALSAFFWFCNDERGKVKALNPEYGVGDISKELGRRWADVSPDTKSKYEAMAEKDKARYDREMTAYKKRLKGGPAAMEAPVDDKKDDSEEGEEDDEEEDGDGDDDE